MKTYQNLNNTLHCLKVMADEEVCEECELYNLGDIHCRDVARSAIEYVKKQIPVTPINTETIGFFCPICGNLIGSSQNYCDKCGQKFNEYEFNLLP